MPTLITPAGRTTFAEVERRARAHARQASALGVRPGDRVALKAGNSAAWLSWLLGLAHLGASIVLVDPRTPHAPTARRLSATGADVLVTDAPGPWSGRLLDVDAAPASEPADGDAVAPPTPEPAAGLDLARWSAMPDALVMASGGSTGDPKPVAKSGHAFLANLEANIEAMDHRPDDVFWPALPLAHQYGLGMAMIAWRLRADLVLCPPERPDVGLRLAADARPTVVDATPATWRAVLALAARRADFDRALDRVRLPCSGAAALPPPLAERVRERLGVPLLDSYGSTELGNLTFATPDRPAGCGRPVRGVRVEARAADGTRLGAGGLGEIVVACEHAMTGYLLDDGLQPPARTDDGWHRTGDLGMVDESGALHVVGRAEVLQRAGRPVHPAAVEHLLRQAGAPGAVVVLPDHDRGRLVCFAEARSPEQRAAVRALVARHCAGDLAVDELRLLAAVPANLNGKPDRAALARQFDPATRGRDAS